MNTQSGNRSSAGSWATVAPLASRAARYAACCSRARGTSIRASIESPRGTADSAAAKLSGTPRTSALISTGRAYAGLGRGGDLVEEIVVRAVADLVEAHRHADQLEADAVVVVVVLEPHALGAEAIALVAVVDHELDLLAARDVGGVAHDRAAGADLDHLDAIIDPIAAQQPGQLHLLAPEAAAGLHAAIIGRRLERR